MIYSPCVTIISLSCSSKTHSPWVETEGRGSRSSEVGAGSACATPPPPARPDCPAVPLWRAGWLPAAWPRPTSPMASPPPPMWALGARAAFLRPPGELPPSRLDFSPSYLREHSLLAPGQQGPQQVARPLLAPRPGSFQSPGPAASVGRAGGDCSSGPRRPGLLRISATSVSVPWPPLLTVNLHAGL